MPTKLLASAIALTAAAGAAHATIIDECDLTAWQVEYFGQGLRNDGTPVLGSRSDPFQALGHPQKDESLNFVSLGFAGELVLSFEERFGEQVTIWETTYGDPSNYREYADVYVGVGGSWDTADWALVGNLANFEDGSPMSLGDASNSLNTEGFDFLKIVDATNAWEHSGSADGFDVDGVCTTAVPAPGPLSLGGLALLLAARRRR